MLYNRDDNLTLAVSITGYVTGKGVYVWYQLRLSRMCCSTTHSTTK